MPPESTAGNVATIVRFAWFEADLRARELRKQGQRLRLQEQPFAVLAVLLERPGDLVTREEFRERLWPADTFVDFDHSLNTAINKLRDVLGDSATDPRFIETLARRGYRFVAAVEKTMNEKPVNDQPMNESAAVAASTSASASAATVTGAGPDDLPRPHRSIARSLFAALQVMYLIFYLVALVHWEGVYRIDWPKTSLPIVFIAVIVTAAIGIPLRFYLLSAAGFDHPRLGEKFDRIFLGVLLLDQLWAIAPFLILSRIGFGPALSATAALLYVPFAERTLVRMAYRNLAG